MGYLVLDEEQQTTHFFEDEEPALARGGQVLEVELPPHLTKMRVNWQTLELEPDLDALRAPLIDRLKQLRDANEFGVVTVPQGQLQIDERSQGRLARTVEAAKTYEALTGRPFSTGWRMFDNSTVPIDLATLGGWTLVIASQVQHVFAIYGARYAEIVTADPARLAALEVEIEEGWDVGAA